MASPIEPEEIDLDSPTSPLSITWEDGHKSVYALEYLRRYCPCASCTEHGATPLQVRLTRPLAPRAFQVKAVREVGRYALNITWADGHDAGLFSFQSLRELCPCHACRHEEAELDV